MALEGPRGMEMGGIIDGFVGGEGNSFLPCWGTPYLASDLLGIESR